MAGRVFISHTDSDKPIARRIATELRNSGIDVWMDESDLTAGSSIGTGVADAIDQADYFVVLISGKSVQSRWVHRELEIAFQKSVEEKFPIIPVRLDRTQVPRTIRDYKRIEFKNNVDGGIQELVKLFRRDNRVASDLRRSPASPPVDGGSMSCVDCLRQLSNRDLRLKITGSFSLNELGVVWFDLFSTRMNDDIPNQELPNAAYELILRSKNRGKFDELLREMCEKHPNICP